MSWYQIKNETGDILYLLSEKCYRSYDPNIFAVVDWVLHVTFNILSVFNLYRLISNEFLWLFFLNIETAKKMEISPFIIIIIYTKMFATHTIIYILSFLLFCL